MASLNFIKYCRNGLDGLKQIFFPHICAGCGTALLQEKDLLCMRCLNDLPFTNFHQFKDNPVEKIFWGRIPLVSVFRFLYVTKDEMLQNLLRQLIYDGRTEIGELFGKQIGVNLPGYTQDPREAIIPCPLHPAKERKRGHNQSGSIAKGISEILN